MNRPEMTRSVHTTLAAVAAIAVLVFGGGSVAYAYFLSGGSGVGSARIGTPSSTAFTITTDGIATPLLPGDPPDGFDVNVTNSTGQDLHVGTIHLRVMTYGNAGDAATSTGADIPSCLASWFSVPTAWGFDQTVPAHSTVSSTSITSPPPAIAMATTDTDQDACQGASVGIEFST
jgi:hypothetical protein